jgi:hypothetical protein
MTESFNTFLHKKVKPVSVLIIEEYVLACITTKYYMIKRTGVMYAWFTCHVWSVSSSCSLSSLTPYSFLMREGRVIPAHYSTLILRNFKNYATPFDKRNDESKILSYGHENIFFFIFILTLK